MEDSRGRSALTATRYEMVQSAGLVRRLIVDGAVDGGFVDRTPTAQLKFEVGGQLVMIGRRNQHSWNLVPRALE